MLERTTALAALLEGTEDRLVITGLGNAANDMAHLSQHAPRVFTMDGVMGAATSIGLGLALARPDREVLVVTGDGEMLMNVGTLATVAVQNPANLTIVVIDNGRYGLTGEQYTATHDVTDLEAVARGFGISRSTTIRRVEDIPAGREVIRAGEAASFVLVKVAPGPGAAVRIERDGVLLRDSFRRHVLSILEGA